jgi:hypothetical protein
MLVQDMIGQPLNEGDPVAIPIGFGQMGVGQVVAISSGLVNPAAPNQPAVPHVTVMIHMNINVQPNGRVSGVTKIGEAPKGIEP